MPACEICRKLRDGYTGLAHAWIIATDQLAESALTANSRERYLLQRTVVRARIAAETARLELESHQSRHGVAAAMAA